MLTLIALLSTGCVSAKDTERSFARMELGQAYLLEGNVEGAIVELRDAVKTDPKSADAWDSLGLAYMARGAHEEAEKAFKKAIRVDKVYAGYRLNYAYLLQKLGRRDEAVVQLLVAREDLTYREPAKVLSNLGWAYLQGEETAAAIAVLEEAVRRQPNFCGAHYNLGAAYAEGDHVRKAVDRFEIVLEMCDDQFPEAALSAGVLLMDAGHVDEGATYLHLCLERWPDTPVAARCREKLKAEGLL